MLDLSELRNRAEEGIVIADAPGEGYPDIVPITRAELDELLDLAEAPSAETPPTVEQGPTPDTPPAAGAAPATYRLWVNMKGTILVRMWDGGAVEVALRDATWETWRPPETLFEEKV